MLSDEEYNDRKGNSEILMFDHMGRTVSVRDNEGNAVFGGYKDADEQKNMLKYYSNMQSRIDNLLKNPIVATADYWR